jgi:hypothetical protein
MMMRIAAASLAVTIGFALILIRHRTGIHNPFDVPIFRHLILFQDYYSLLPFAAILFLALVPQARSAGRQLARVCGERPLAVAAIALLALAAGAQWVYHATPLSMDEYAATFQAKAFAEGKLAGTLPPALLDWLFPEWMGQFFRIDRVGGQVVSGYWPGFSLLLTPFAKLGVPWLLNPLLGAATVLVVHRLALELFGDRESAGFAVLLTLASPAVTINAMSYYSMPAHLLANGLFMLLLLRPTAARVFAAGLLGSLALVLHNPAPHALFALPWIVWLAFQPRRLGLLAALAAGYAPLCIFLGWGWPRFIDHLGSGATLATVATPAEMSSMLADRLGAVVGWHPAPGLGPAQVGALIKLWLWSAPALVAVAVLGAWRLRGERGPWRPMIFSALLTYVGYFFIRFDQGHGWGARYFHSAWIVLPLLAVAAWKKGGPARDEGEANPLPGYVAACALLSLVVLTGFRSLQVEQFISRHLAQLPSPASGSARVLIVNPANGYYAWDLPQNDPFLRNQPIRMTSVNAPRDAAMMAERFPEYRLLGFDRRGTVWGP